MVSIISSLQIMSAPSASVGTFSNSDGFLSWRPSGSAEYWPSNLKGPRLPLASPSVLRQSSSQRLVTQYTRSPSTVGDEQTPKYSQSLTLPDLSLGTVSCQRNLPSASLKHISTPRSMSLYFNEADGKFLWQ